MQSSALFLKLKGIHQQKCLATSYSKIFCHGLCIIKEEDNLRKSTDIKLIILAVYFLIGVHQQASGGCV